MEYIKKAAYLESAKKQSRYYELAEVALRVVGQNIPENGKRFNNKNLEEINEKGTTVIVVTHNLEIVKVMKKRVITIKKGLVVSDSKDGDSDED